MSVSESTYIQAYCDLCDKIILKRALLLISEHRDGIDFRPVTVNVIFTSSFTMKYVHSALNAKPKPY
jgi:hypothetical protein